MQIDVVHTGLFKLDGGAMFGVVPKRVWTRYNMPDEDNMCSLAMRSILIQTGNRKILVDTGIGNKQDEKFMSFFQPHGDQSLFQSLEQYAISPEAITDVLLTHFHFDHVGGAVLKDAAGKLVPAFPNATYWSNELHYNWACNPNPREKASFLKENFQPLKDQDRLKFIDPVQDIEFAKGIKLKFVYGHTEAMMLPIISLDAQRTVAFCADLVPSHGHVGLPYIMSYDIRPLQTMKEKEAFYEEALDQNYILLFEHDKEFECCTLRKDERGRVGIKQLSSLAQALSNISND